MDLWDSIVRIVWDPAATSLVLVDFGDPMWDPVTIDGSQEVQTSRYVRGDGVKNFPRGNESHELRFTLAREIDSTVDAFEERLANTLTLPRTMADVLIQFESGRQFLLKNAAIRAWPNGQEDHLTRESLVILGGEIVETATVYTIGNTWGAAPDAAILLEDGTPLEAEDFTYILTEA
jgi:hypothetical protein